MTDEHKIVSISVFGSFMHIKRVQLWFADGRLIQYGEEGEGAPWSDPFFLNADEYLVKVEGYTE